MLGYRGDLDVYKRQDFDRLVLPGGESTVQGKLLDELGMLEELRACIAESMPVLGTCAGLIDVYKRQHIGLVMRLSQIGLERMSDIGLVGPHRIA